MKLDEIFIRDIGGISFLNVPFNDQMSIICGPNGVGKTTILECIAHCFSRGPTEILKRNVNADKGEIVVHFRSIDGTRDSAKISLSEFDPNQKAEILGKYDLSKYFLSLKTSRTFSYRPLNSVSKDAEKPVHTLWTEAIKGVKFDEIKNWFVNRYLYSAHDGALTEGQIANLQLAKDCFSALSPRFQFRRVVASSNEIIVATPSGEIYYEYLSSGFKSCLSILFGLIKEIEYRFSSDGLTAAEFPGIVLIDEIDMHLHPAWQSIVPQALTRIFPRAQFIVTTHSPHVIQAAEPNQIIALETTQKGVEVRSLPSAKFGYRGWTIDEVLTDVMGMEDTRSEYFRSLVSDFGKAVDEEDAVTAERIFSDLDEALHPDNPSRKLYRMQLTSIGGVHPRGRRD